MSDTKMRENIVELLRGEGAHVSVQKALEGLPPEQRGVRPVAGVHSVYEMLEHMRIAQEDILRYTLDAAGWKSPPWPSGYWPEESVAVAEETWESTCSHFFSDLEETVKLAQNPSIDLVSAIPHGEGRTYLREILLVADHNAFHAGQIVQTRKLLGCWG